MRNPFRYGTVVAGEAFCNRLAEQRDLRRAIDNADKMFVYSERRLGKTSLVRSVLDKLPKRGTVRVYVDLWPTDNEATFVTQTAKAIAEATATTAGKLLESARTLFSSLSPQVAIDAQGKTTVSFRAVDPSRSEQHLEEVLAVPAALAARGKRVVVAFDECQRILEYGSDLVERKLRSTIQHHGDVCYLFLGSRKHLIQTMFLDKSRPLYRAAGHYPLGAIEEKHWKPFIRRRFEDADKRIDDDHIAAICELTEGHPFYTQHLCHALWESCEPGGAVADGMVDQALDLLLARESHAYSVLWESLAMNQRRLLVGLAVAPQPVQPYSSAFTREFGLRSASNAQRAAEAMLERDLIDRDGGSFVIVDRFFKLWLKRTMARGS